MNKFAVGIDKLTRLVVHSRGGDGLEEIKEGKPAPNINSFLVLYYFSFIVTIVKYLSCRKLNLREEYSF